jgi:hypothetical protein
MQLTACAVGLMSAGAGTLPVLGLAAAAPESHAAPL